MKKVFGIETIRRLNEQVKEEQKMEMKDETKRRMSLWEDQLRYYEDASDTIVQILSKFGQKGKEAVLDKVAVKGGFATQEELDAINKECEEEKESEKGYFDDVTTWAEAIEKMEGLDLIDGLSLKGRFKIIDGRLYFDLCLCEGNDYSFLNNKPLITKNREENKDEQKKASGN